MSDNPVENILSRLNGIKKDGKGWMALCPAHEDHTPSLSIGVGDNGKLLLHCHAGCTVAMICHALGMEERDLFATDNGPPKRRAAKPKPPSIVYPSVDAYVETLGDRYVIQWDYHNRDGQVVMTIVRYRDATGKTFRPLHPVIGGWSIGDPPGKLPLYRLPDLDGKPTIFVVEGEKCADFAVSIGLTTTTSAHGSLAARKTDWQPLAGLDIAILPDNDDPGRAYAEIVATILTGLTPSARVKIVTLPGLPVGGDIVDYIEAMRTALRR